MKKRINKNKIIFLILLIIFLPVFLFRTGIPFRYDWAWPIFSLNDFLTTIGSSSGSGLMTIFSKYFELILGIFGLIGASSSFVLKLLLVIAHVSAFYGFFLFMKSRLKEQKLLFISSIAYSFTAYIFIRTIVGFTGSIIAYGVLPIFLFLYFHDKKSNFIYYILLGFLFSLIFTQPQAGFLVVLLLVVNLLVVLILNRLDFLMKLKHFGLTLFFLLIVNIPWIVYFLAGRKNIEVVGGGIVTTLNFVASLPHSSRYIFMLSDHHITANFFYPLAHDKLFLLGWLIVWFVAFCAIFSKKNRELVWTFIISSLIVLPFIKGPTGIFGKFYIWFFNHFPQIAVFRETYHFEFLYAISLCVLFAFGLDWLWSKLNSYKVIKLKVIKSEQRKSDDFLLTNNFHQKLTNLILTSSKAVLAGSAVFIIAPYLTFDYAGYLKLQNIPNEYYQLHQYFKENKNVCHKIYYPPGIGFVYFKDDKTLGASNSDILASSLGVPYLTDGTSVLNLPSDEMFYRNELVSQFYEKQDNGEFADLLNEGGIDCVILRLDMESKYNEASNLWQEKNSAVVKKWNQTDLKALTDSKKGLELEKRFGDNIYIYKVDPTTKLQIDRNYEITNNVGKPVVERFPLSDTLRPTTYTLPLTDWANNYAYYKDGWSRGRYDFWRKHIFTQLRQDFIYTDKSGSTLKGKIEKAGDYEVWTRCLTGGTVGEFQIRIQNKEYRIQKDAGEERFVWKKLGDIKLSGQTNIEIKNINGENAIADIVLVKR